MIQRSRRRPGERSLRGINNILQRHVDDGDRDQRLDQRREPEPVRHEAESRRYQRDRMPDGERGDDDHERPQPPERKHQAEQEQQVIDAFEDVPEARDDEAQCGLLPARIERTRPGSP